MKAVRDLTDQRFGRLHALRFIRVQGRDSWWMCRCTCGVEKEVRSRHLTTGAVKSCGCLRSEVAAAKQITHGETRLKKPSVEYVCWASMIQRCHDKAATCWERYGGRGITVCDRWRKFENFLADMGRKPDPSYTIERKDNSAGYSPENCCWATKETQNNNTRANRFLEFEGTRMTVTQWSRKIGIKASCLMRRLNLGWTHEAILTRPSKQPTQTL